MANDILSEAQVRARIDRGDYPAYHSNNLYVVFDDSRKAKVGVMTRLARRGLVQVPAHDGVGAKFTAPKQASA